MLLAALLATAAPSELPRLRAQAARVTITRDDWGIAHVHGRSDADAVFGAVYAQAEDDFPRIEANYLTALGRTAEAEGEGALWADLRQRLFADPASLKAQYRASPAWLRALMDSWAAGLNFYLATHPEVKPKALTRFEPWMALSFTEGSIGGDIEKIDLDALAAFYGRPPKRIAAARDPWPAEPDGSNGIAIAPANTKNGRALLLINPHTSFYFRSELQMTSDAGLNAYGASTWGQFFIYQGFNAKAGWMHTSSTVDAVDEFAETIETRGSERRYRFGTRSLPVTTRTITLNYRMPDGTAAARTFTTFATRHGPIVADRGGKWIAAAMMWKPVPALEQSWLRTRATDLTSYMQVAERQANSSNDTLFADAKGEIAYLRPQFTPVRDDRFDYTKAVDGSDPATAWGALHATGTLPNVLRPRTGWAFNTNNGPWWTSGPDSPVEARFPRYMDQTGQNARGLHADRLLEGRRDWTPETLIAAAYDPALPAFETLVPWLVAAWDALPPADLRRAALAEPIRTLRAWDRRWSADSIPTALAIFWGDELWRRHQAELPADWLTTRTPERIPLTPAARLAALDAAVATLTRDFGSWRTPWGAINRFQRIDPAIRPRFDDAQPSTPVPFTASRWGSLAAFGSKTYPNTKRWYGNVGNSFVAVVEFGPRVRAWAVMAGGQSGNPASPHFADQIDRYAAGRLRSVYFWPDELAGHVERRYRPGE
ncbi:penicillin acylase family protein [Sphingomonas jatrophae]|uniref:Acyl-homoserine-lactone acylase n=1 Tax=Sphingomonas jatrophae TaxID=1166337 RepID=A0A1I6JJ44_9SPHN|nr:penicillin acylase family protein [Sphingomonas jatrophae]SFR78919.1 acyl-homoserine-lactone acylase [Sphingomonas jatrophae]